MAAELSKAAKKIRSLPNQMVRVGAKTVADPLTKAYVAAAGGDGKLSGVPGMSAFKARTSVRGDASARGRVGMVPAGPAKWVNDGTRPRRQGRGRHPGTKGKGTFDDTASRELLAAQRAMTDLFEKALKG